MVSLILTVVFVILFSKAISYIGKDAICDFLWANLYLRLSPDANIRRLQQTQARAAQVNTERSNTSAQNEFARWAKLDREHGKLRQEIDAIQSALATKKTSFKSVAKVALFGVTTGAKIVLRLRYRKTAMFWLPPGVLPYYAYWFLSFSSAPMGSVSVSSWLFIADWSISLVEYFFSGVYQEFVVAASPAPPTTPATPAEKEPERVAGNIAHDIPMADTD